MKTKFITQKSKFSNLERWQSYLMPKLLKQGRDERTLVPFEILFQNNSLVYNTPNANQSNKELKYVFNQLFYKEAIYGQTFKNVLILGLGLGSVVTLLQKSCEIKHVVALESNLEIIEILETYYEIKNMDIICQDIENFTTILTFDLIILDVFEDNIIPNFISNSLFLNKLKNYLTPNGILIWNTLNHKIEYEISSIFSKKVDVTGGNTFLIYNNG